MPSLPEALAPLRAWLAENHPGATPRQLVVQLPDGQLAPIPLPPPPAVAAAPSPPPAASSHPFIPTAVQQAILDALDGVAMRTQALGAAVGDKGRLYKPGGLQELRERGLVDHHDRLGFFRPDAPPEALA